MRYTPSQPTLTSDVPMYRYVADRGAISPFLKSVSLSL